MPYSRMYNDEAGVHTKPWCLTIPSSDIELDVVVEFDFTPGEAAQTYGRPENCHPGTADEVEIISVVGAESGLCCMEMIERELIPLRYPQPGRTHQTLRELLIDEMLDVALSGR